jgi:zinc transporter ZupT
MSPTLLTFLSVFAISLISLIGIFALALRDAVLKKVLVFIVALAAGALLANSLFHLIPESFELFASAQTAGLWIIAGILLFFVLEKYLRWHHHHGAVGERGEEAVVVDRIAGARTGAAPLHHDAVLVRKRDRASPLRDRRTYQLAELLSVGGNGDRHRCTGSRQSHRAAADGPPAGSVHRPPLSRR